MYRTKRRTFIKNSTIAGAGFTFLMYAGKAIAGSPNETINVAMIGTGGRSYALTEALSACTNVRVSHACDADSKRLEKYIAAAEKTLGYQPAGVIDFRKILENADVDAIAVATPEHWHAPMAILGMEAGKHVYLEKPCSHNPHENELLVAAYKKYNKVCQMGNQQRSSITSQKAIQAIRDGAIGEAYSGKAWYANTRGSIGIGKKTPVPDYLDWELWQGPAPREDYRDNVHPYNWHWFRTWGTGEIHNNGTHEIDICRWALDVKYPTRVVSTGGRLHFEDDWEFYDTQLASFEFEGGKTINWEGRSCNGHPFYNRGRGAVIHGTKGSLLLDRGGYILMDLKGEEVKSEREPDPGTSTSTSDTSGFDGLSIRHLQNFANAIRTQEKLHAPIDDASISTQLCHLGNIAQDLQQSLQVDTKNGRVLNNKKALELWQRDYEKGWEPKV